MPRGIASTHPSSLSEGQGPNTTDGIFDTVPSGMRLMGCSDVQAALPTMVVSPSRLSASRLCCSQSQTPVGTRGPLARRTTRTDRSPNLKPVRFAVSGSQAGCSGCASSAKECHSIRAMMLARHS